VFSTPEVMLPFHPFGAEILITWDLGQITRCLCNISESLQLIWALEIAIQEFIIPFTTVLIGWIRGLIQITLITEPLLKLSVLLAIRLADAEILPYNFTNYANRLESYIQNTRDFLNSTNSTYAIKLDAISVSVAGLTDIARKIEAQQQDGLEGFLSLEAASSLNDRIFLSERQFLTTQGLPGRPFFKHVVQAPGLYTGYAYEPFPGLTEAIRVQNWTLATQQVEVIAHQIASVVQFLTVIPAPTPESKPNNTWKLVAIVVPVAVVIVTLIIVGIVIYVKKNRVNYAALYN